MNTMLVLSIETILLLFYLNVFRAEYLVSNEDLDGHKKIYSKIYMPNWIPGSYVRILKSHHEQLGHSDKNEPSMVDADGNRAENDFPIQRQETKSRFVKLAVRQSMAITVKKILEELLILVSEDIEKTGRLTEELKRNLGDSDFRIDELPKRNLGNSLIQNVKSHLDREQTESARDMPTAGVQVPGNVIPFLRQYFLRHRAMRYRNIAK